jgi:hypothetical protein
LNGKERRLYNRIIRGEGHLTFGIFSNFSIEIFNQISGVDNLPNFQWEVKENGKFVPVCAPTFSGLIKGYHLNRSVFDEQMLDEVKSKGVAVLRPATIVIASFSAFNNELEVEGKTIRVQSKWLIDTSGRARYIANTLNWNDQKIELNTGSIMAHFKHIAPAELWDTPKNEHWDTCSIGLRKFSTTHLMRKNSWWWIIRLDDVNTSIGVVFDKNKVQFDTYESYLKLEVKEINKV